MNSVFLSLLGMFFACDSGLHLGQPFELALKRARRNSSKMDAWVSYDSSIDGFDFKKEFPFHKFELKDQLMNSCRSLLMLIMCLYLNKVGGQISPQPNASSPLRVQFQPKVSFDSPMLWGFWPPYYTVMFGKILVFSLAETEHQLSLDELSRDQVSGLFTQHL